MVDPTSMVNTFHAVDERPALERNTPSVGHHAGIGMYAANGHWQIDLHDIARLPCAMNHGIPVLELSRFGWFTIDPNRWPSHRFGIGETIQASRRLRTVTPVRDAQSQGESQLGCG